MPGIVQLFSAVSQLVSLKCRLSAPEQACMPWLSASTMADAALELFYLARGRQSWSGSSMPL